jgi:hypothetical protein
LRVTRHSVDAAATRVAWVGAALALGCTLILHREPLIETFVLQAVTGTLWGAGMIRQARWQQASWSTAPALPADADRRPSRPAWWVLVALVSIGLGSCFSLWVGTGWIVGFAYATPVFVRRQRRVISRYESECGRTVWYERGLRPSFFTAPAAQGRATGA